MSKGIVNSYGCGYCRTSNDTRVMQYARPLKHEDFRLDQQEIPLEDLIIPIDTYWQCQTCGRKEKIND